MARASLDDLSAFACVAAAGSFTGAAKRLGTSTSNLSHTLRRLETRIDTKLLYRTSRSVRPTEAGSALLATLAPAFDAIDTALVLLDEGKGQVAGALRLTATRQAYKAVIQPILPAFLQAHPKARVEVLIDYAFRDIVADGFDAGIRLGEKLERDMIALKIGPDLRMAVVATPAYLKDAPPIRHPRDLTGQRSINYRMTGNGALYAWEFERDGKAFSVQTPGPLAFNEPELMLEAALAGLGVGYLLEHSVSEYLVTGQLVRLLDEWTPPFPGFYIYYSSRHQLRPVLAAFLKLLRTPI